MKSHVLGLLINKCQKINLKGYDYHILFKLDESILEYLANETHLMNFNSLLKIALDFYQYHCNFTSNEIIAIMEKCQSLFDTSVRDLVINFLESKRVLIHSELITPTLDIISHNINYKRVEAIIEAVCDPYLYELGMSLEVASYLSSLNEDIISPFAAIYSCKLSSENLKTYMEIYKNCPNKEVAYYVYQAFINITTVEHKFNANVAKIISKSKSYLAFDLYVIGSSKDLYDANLTEESLKVMQNAKPYNSYKVRLLLIDKHLIENKQSLIKAKILCLSKNEVDTSLIYYLLKSDCFTDNISSILALLILDYKVSENIAILKELCGERVKTSRLVADMIDFLKDLEKKPVIYNYALNSFNNILIPYFGLEIKAQALETVKEEKKETTYNDALIAEYQLLTETDVSVKNFGERVRMRIKKEAEDQK